MLVLSQNTQHVWTGKTNKQIKNPSFLPEHHLGTFLDLLHHDLAPRDSLSWHILIWRWCSITPQKKKKNIHTKIGFQPSIVGNTFSLWTKCRWLLLSAKSNCEYIFWWPGWKPRKAIKSSPGPRLTSHNVSHVNSSWKPHGLLQQLVEERHTYLAMPTLPQHQK